MDCVYFGKIIYVVETLAPEPFPLAGDHTTWVYLHCWGCRGLRIPVPGAAGAMAPPPAALALFRGKAGGAGAVFTWGGRF